MFLYSYRNMYVSVHDRRYSVIWDVDKEIRRMYNKELKREKE